MRAPLIVSALGLNLMVLGACAGSGGGTSTPVPTAAPPAQVANLSFGSAASATAILPAKANVTNTIQVTLDQSVAFNAQVMLNVAPPAVATNLLNLNGIGSVSGTFVPSQPSINVLVTLIVAGSAQNARVALSY